MSAAISNQWWAAKGLLTEQERRTTDTQKHTYSYQRPEISGMERQEAGGSGEQ